MRNSFYWIRAAGLRCMHVAWVFVCLFVLLMGTVVNADKEPPQVVIMDAVTGNISIKEAHTFNKAFRMCIVQSRKFSVLSSEETKNFLIKNDRSIPKACFDEICLKLMAELVSGSQYVFGARMVKRLEGFTLALRVYESHSGRVIASLEKTSSGFALIPFVTEITEDLLNRMESGKKKSAERVLIGENFKQLLLASGVFGVTGVLLAGKQLGWFESQHTGDYVPVVKDHPAGNLSNLRGFFSMPSISAKHQGRGLAGIAAVDDGNAAHINPAGLSKLKKEWVSYTQSTLPKDIPSFYLGYASPFIYNLYQAIGVRYEGDGLASEATLHMALAMDMAPLFQYVYKMRMGVNLKGYFVSVGHEGTGLDRVRGHSYGGGVDIGFQFPIVEKMEGAIVVYDAYSYLRHNNQLTLKSYNEALPPLFVIGFVYHVTNSLAFAIDGEKAILSEQVDHIRLGATKTLFNMLDLRLGANQILGLESTRNVTAGFGLKATVERHTLEINYGFSFGTEMANSLTNIHQFSVDVGF
ncbi:MAG: hypothetical protein HQK83_11900 [Fibrobacteria bacterium]|nr:hypothetical protein [Fibrobacteria bacterium]